MKILFLTNHLNIGGISSYLLQLGKGLKSRNHMVYIASSGGKLQEAFVKNGISFIPIPIKTKSGLSPKIIFSFFSLCSALREENIDIIHANTRVTCVLANLLYKAYGIKYVSTCHGFFKRKLLRRLFPLWGQIVIAISSPVREHLVSDFNVRSEKIRLIYNGVNLEKTRFTQGQVFKIRQDFGIKSSPTAGIIARLSDVKGHKFLIEAMGEVIETIPDAQLLIVGEGKEKDRLINQVKEMRLEKNIVFIPSVEDTSRVLSMIDLFVMPSLQEGLGLSIMEAMAKGLAVVASDIGGIKSVIKNDFNGRLVKPKDVAMLSKAILELLRNKKKAKLFGKNARKTVEEKFSLDKMVLETERVYLECLNARD